MFASPAARTHKGSTRPTRKPAVPHATTREAERSTSRGAEATPREWWDFSNIPSSPSGHANDALEREANLLAERAMLPPVADRGRGPRAEGARASPDPRRAAQTETPLSSAAAEPASRSRALEPGIRTDMGTRFGHDFSHVRVHSDEAAAKSAERLHARAYTVGSDIVFGSGQYAPGHMLGRSLLAHELAHVVQQSRGGFTAVQRQDSHQPAPAQTGTSGTNPVPTAPKDAETLLGERLLKDFPLGISIAFYAPMPGSGEEAQKAATKWGTRESALGLKGKTIAADKISFGSALADDDHPLVSTLQALGPVLTKATDKARPATADMPLPGTGPATVKTLAVFAHGTSNWCGLGAIDSSHAASVIKSIAPQLASSVTVVLYSCNAGREPDKSEDWVRDTMQGGGAKSLAAKTRDALVAEGRGGGTVWGHTTTGHVSENFALREFSATDGKGTEGRSFVATYVFSGGDRAVIASDLLDGINTLGFHPTTESAGKAIIDQAVTEAMYMGYAAANANLKFRDGAKLAEAAPVHAVEVGTQIKEYWTKTYWPAQKKAAAAQLLERLKDAKKVTKN